MSVEPDRFSPAQNRDASKSHEPPRAARLPWERPRLTRVEANEAQAKSHHGVEAISHLSS
jgi:hypothetical protein